MVAQQILVLLVKVRILVGQPPFKTAKAGQGRLPGFRFSEWSLKIGLSFDVLSHVATEQMNQWLQIYKS